MENTPIGYALAFVVFAATFVGTLVFFVRSWRDGYWGKHGEDVKYQVFEDRARPTQTSPDRLKGIPHA